MQKYYTIGETSKILGLSIQALRYYDKINLLQPNYINTETGYRYYTYDQFHYLDRIKYLKYLGLSLSEIKEVLKSGNVAVLLPYLKYRRDNVVRELQRQENFVEELQWYIDYFSYFPEDDFAAIPYRLMLKRRYLLVVPCLPEEERPDFHVRLHELRNSPRYAKSSYRRQFVHILDFDSVMHKQLGQTHIGMYLKDPDDSGREEIMILPSGEYLCFRGRIMTDDWDPSVVTRYFEGKPKPKIVLAIEYEDNLHVYAHCLYEVQFLIKEII